MELKTSLGDNKTLDIPLTWEGAPFSPVTGDTLIFTVKAAPTDADASALIQKITGGGGITFSGRTATVTLLHADTADLEPATTYFDIQHQDGVTGAVKTLTPPGSRLELKRDITRETTTSVTVVSNEPGSPGGPPQVKSANFTAANNVTYHTTASLTITDPSPVEGRGYTVLVLAGTTTIGGVGYSVAGTLLNRVYEDGEWTTYNQSASGGDVSGPASAVANNFASYDGAGGKTIKDSGSNAASFAAASHTHPLDDIYVEDFASATLDPSGSNNAILITADVAGEAGNDKSVEIVIDSTTDRTQLTVAEDEDDITITSGDKRRMIVTGTLTDGTDPVVFPPLIHHGGSIYTDTGFLSGDYLAQYSTDRWFLICTSPYAVWQSTPGAEEFPDEVVTWTPVSAETGTPVVTASAATAAQAITAFNSEIDGLTASNAPGNDGTGTLAAVAQTSLTGGEVAVTPASIGAAPELGADDNYVTDAEKTKLANLSGTNTGDQDLSSLATKTGTETLTNKRIPPRITTITSSGTPTVNSDNCDMVTITALAEAITSMTSGLTGTPNNGEMLLFRIKDDGTARAITWGASFEANGAALPTTTVISKRLTALFQWDSVTSKWGCLSTSQEA